MPAHSPESDAASSPPSGPGWWVALATAVAYTAVGWLALLLAGPPGYASPLYPSAGLALAATLVYGRAALPGVALGSFAVNLLLATLRHPGVPPDLLLPAAIALGATLQAGLGTALLRRYVPQPMTLTAPREILLSGLLGAGLACLVSASLATTALLAAGTLAPEAAVANWATWWVGDTLGVLIGAPLVLAFIARPRADWAPRRMTVALPLLLATAMLATAINERARWDQDRLAGQFQRDTDRLAASLRAQLQAPVHALQALHGAVRARGDLDETGLRAATQWWLAQPLELQAMGYSLRVPKAELAEFEAQARAQGLADYRVFNRSDGPGGLAQALAADTEVLALRLIEPRAGNAGALGVNTLSIPAARAAVLAARRSGEPRATAGFALTQSSADETGVVLYQALYAGEPTTPDAREAAFRGVVFVTMRTKRVLSGRAADAQDYLRWCVLDPAPDVPLPVLAGNADCHGTRAGSAVAAGPAPWALQPGAPARFTAERPLELGGRPLRLQVSAALAGVPGADQSGRLLLSLSGLVAAALLGALLLTVTGHTRRTERAVARGTAELRREMTERTRAQQALADSEARLRSILNNLPLGVMFLDISGRVIETNPRLCVLLKRQAEHLHGMLLSDLVHDEELADVQQQRRSLMRGHTPVVQRQLRMLDGDGQWLPVKVSATALRNPQGRVLRMVAVLEDISEHLRLEASERALQRAEAANLAKSEFVSRMSHELRTPLNAMIGFAQLLGLDREPGLVAHQREWTQQIQRAGWHLLEMINETLDLARIEAGAVQLVLQPVEVAPLVAACRAMLAAGAAERQVRLLEDLAADAPAMLGDATRVKQILTNLMSNAIKYNREGGSVTVSARRDGPEHVLVAVQDTGLGMSATQMDSLFQPYNRLGRESSGIEGTGIGLVISRRLAELMGGTLEVHSVTGEGSVFSLRLPAAEPQAPAPGEDVTRELPSYQLRRVHYVEDNPTNVEVMRGILAQRPQVRLQVSTMGLDGLSAIRADRPDLILLDMQLPDISGLELLRHLKQDVAVADIPVIVVSADATAGRIEEALTLGALQYVTKPVEVARFLHLLDEVLDGMDTRWGL